MPAQLARAHYNIGKVTYLLIKTPEESPEIWVLVTALFLSGNGKNKPCLCIVVQCNLVVVKNCIQHIHAKI